MTTREYILNQAKESYEKLNTNDLDIAKHTLDLSCYNKRNRAHILYNHLFYSNLPIELIQSIIDNKTYKIIINHKNYSPRIIEQLTTKLSNIDAGDYSNQFIYNLDHPFGIWEKAFNSQISQGSKYILFLLLSISNPILLSDLKIVVSYLYNNILKFNEKNFNLYDLKNYLKELENSFIKIDLTDKTNHYVDFLNPSIKDFLLSFITEDKNIVLMLIKSSLYFDQFIYTIRYLAVKFIEECEVVGVINSKILSDFDGFSNPHKIQTNHRQTETNLTSLYKIHNLMFYLKNCQDKDVKQFIFNEFKKNDLRNLSFLEEKKFIEFYIEYKSELRLDLEHIMEIMVGNITWYDNVKNLTMLRSANQKIFDKYIKENIHIIYEKVKNSILKEIEFHDNKNGLDYFKSSLVSDPHLSIYTISIKEFETEFEEKFSKIDEVKNDNIFLNVENTNEMDNYDEDELFKIEMFL